MGISEVYRVKTLTRTAFSGRLVAVTPYGRFFQVFECLNRAIHPLFRFFFKPVAQNWRIGNAGTGKINRQKKTYQRY